LKLTQELFGEIPAYAGMTKKDITKKNPIGNYQWDVCCM